MSSEQTGTDNIGNKNNVRDEDSVSDRDVLIDKLKNRIAFLEKELLSGKEELQARHAEHRLPLEALKESEIEFHTLFEHAGVAIFLADTATGEIIDCNLKAEEMVGRPRGEIIGLHQTELHPADKAEEYRKMFARPLSSTDTNNFEAEVQHRDGRVIPIMINAVPLKIANREIMVGFFLDITERKQAEESFHLMQHVIDHVQDWVSLVMPDGRFRYVNDAHCQALGYTREELLARHIWDVDVNVTEDRWPRIWSELKEKGFLRVEDLHRAMDGRTFPTEICVSYLNFHGVEYMCGFVRDITERKQAEAALRDALLESSRFRMATENVPAYIYMKDLQSRYIYANKPTLELFGCSAEELAGSDDARFFPPETVKWLREIDRRVFAGEQTYEEVDVPDMGSGRRVYLEIKTPIYADLEGKKVSGLLGISTDITERKRAEEELATAKARAEIYLDLMGHDINNMNQSIQGFLELALQTLEMDGKIGMDGKVLIEKPLQAVRSSTRLISNVRKLQQLSEEGVKTRPVDLHDLFEELSSLDFHVGGRDATINVHDVPHCLVEGSDLLRDVFFNLISNAVKHSRPDRSVNVDVKAYRISQEGRTYYKCTVEDNGPGIVDELKPRLFHRFQRGKTKAGGKGLGLYLVRTLVEGYHGKVWVEDRVPGDHTQGARFVVMLPAAEG